MNSELRGLQPALKELWNAYAAKPSISIGDWKVLDSIDEYYLLYFPYKEYNDYHNCKSCIAIVMDQGEKPKLLYFQNFLFDICDGLINPATHHAIIARYHEFDDSVYERYGEDHVLILDYSNGHSHIIAAYRFYNQYFYRPELIRIAINRQNNWIAVARREEPPRMNCVVVHVYNLLCSSFIIESKALDVSSIKTIEFAEDNATLIVKDESNKAHELPVSETELYHANGFSQKAENRESDLDVDSPDVSLNCRDTKLDNRMRADLAKSCHYLRYFIFGGYLVFLVKVLEQLGHESSQGLFALLASSTTLICLAMDLRNYRKYAKLKGQMMVFGPITVLLTLFYLGWLIWFTWLAFASV